MKYPKVSPFLPCGRDEALSRSAAPGDGPVAGIVAAGGGGVIGAPGRSVPKSMRSASRRCRWSARAGGGLVSASRRPGDRRGAGGSQASAANSVTSGRPGGTIPASAAWLYWSGWNPKEPATSIPRDLAPACPSRLPSGWVARVGPDSSRPGRPIRREGESGRREQDPGGSTSRAPSDSDSTSVARRRSQGVVLPGRPEVTEFAGGA